MPQSVFGSLKIIFQNNVFWFYEPNCPFHNFYISKNVKTVSNSRGTSALCNPSPTTGVDSSCPSIVYLHVPISDFFLISS